METSIAGLGHERRQLGVTKRRDGGCRGGATERIVPKIEGRSDRLQRRGNATVRVDTGMSGPSVQIVQVARGRPLAEFAVRRADVAP